MPRVVRTTTKVVKLPVRVTRKVTITVRPVR